MRVSRPIAGAIASHEGEADPHPVYETDARVDSRLALNQVKLPSPAVSDYITPSAVLASSFFSQINSGSVLRIHPDGITNEANIYDGIADTYAYPTTDLAAGEEREVIVWDLGSGEWTINWRICGAVSYSAAHIDTSPDDVTWTTQASKIDAPPAEGTFTATFRYIRFRGENLRDAITPADFFRCYTLEARTPKVKEVIDDDITTSWRPDPVNEVNAWVRIDMGALKICAGCRIYWGADANYRPTAYRIEVSEDGTTWITAVTETTDPGEGWKEYSWHARYARYIRMIVDTHGAIGTEVFEIDYYSRIVDRVASEHGHGSGVVPHLPVMYSEGHPAMRRGETLRAKVKDLPSLLEYLDFILNDIG